LREEELLALLDQHAAVLGQSWGGDEQYGQSD
jgi:hypothetical protein